MRFTIVWSPRPIDCCAPPRRVRAISCCRCSRSRTPVTSLEGHEPLMLAIMLGLLVGKPIGLTLASYAAVKLGWAIKPEQYSWRQLAGAGALAGIGFTRSLFIATEAFPNAADFSAAKIAIFTASVLSAIIGVAVLWNAEEKRDPAAESAKDLQVAS